MLQLVFDILLTLLTIIIICGVLIALQFPIVMSSPITALGFAVLITVSLGSVSAKVGTILAPLPIFALILVSTSFARSIDRVLHFRCSCFDQFQSTTKFIERDYAHENGEMSEMGFVIIFLSLYVVSGCAYDASGIVASVGGFSCDFVDYSFQFPNCTK